MCDHILEKMQKNGIMQNILILLHNYKLMHILNIKLRIWIFFESITASHVQSPLYDTVSHYHTGPIYMRENITVERPPYATGIEHHSYIYEAMWAKIR